MPSGRLLATEPLSEERLKDIWTTNQRLGRPSPTVTALLDEIERLKGESKALVGHSDHVIGNYCGDVERLTAENARLKGENGRLREALERYANPENWDLDGENHCVVWDAFELEEAQPNGWDESGTKLARTALREEQ